MVHTCSEMWYFQAEKGPYAWFQHILINIISHLFPTFARLIYAFLGLLNLLRIHMLKFPNFVFTAVLNPVLYMKHHHHILLKHI